MKFSMFSSSSSSSSAKVKVKLPSEPTTPTLRCLINGPFRDLHFSVTDHRITPVHDVVFLDEVDNPSVTPLIYRPKRSTSPADCEKYNGHTNGIQHDCEDQEGHKRNVANNTYYKKARERRDSSRGRGESSVLLITKQKVKPFCLPFIYAKDSEGKREREKLLATAAFPASPKQKSTKDRIFIKQKWDLMGF